MPTSPATNPCRGAAALAQANLRHQIDRQADLRIGAAGARAEEDAGPGVADRAGHRRGHRLGHLHGHRHGDRRQPAEAGRLDGFAVIDLIWACCTNGAVAGRPGRGAGAGALAGAGGDRLRAHGALLCGAGEHDPDRRLGLHLHLCDAGRAGRVDHRLGPDPRVRLLEHERQRGLRGARGGSAGLAGHPSRSEVALARVSAAGLAGSRRQGHLRARAGTSGFDIPAFLIVLLLTVVLVRGIRESARTNNIMVLVKIAAILLFIFFGAQLYPSGQLSSVLAQRLDRRAGRRLDHLLHLHRLRLGLDRARGVQEPAARCAHRHHRHADRLHHPVHRRGRGADGHGAVADGRGRWRAGGQRAEARLADCRAAHRLHWVRLAVLLGAIVGHDLVDPGRSSWGRRASGLRCSRDRLLPDVFSPRASAVPHAGLRDVGRGDPGGDPGGAVRRRHVRRDVEHRHAVRVRAGVDRRDRAARTRTRSGTAASACRSARSIPVLSVALLHPADGGSAGDHLGAVLRLAGHRAGGLLLLQPQAQRVLCGRIEDIKMHRGAPGAPVSESTCPPQPMRPDHGRRNAAYGDPHALRIGPGYRLTMSSFVSRVIPSALAWATNIRSNGSR